MGVEPKIGVENPPNHPFVHRVFHEINHPFWGVKFPIFGSTPIWWKPVRIENSLQSFETISRVVQTLEM